MPKITVKQEFGGNWTEKKLEKVKKYLQAYSTIMKKQNFTFAYVDAFAGTGYRELKKDKITKKNESLEFLISDSLQSQEPQEFMDGSAKIALQIQPEFDKYIFVEKDPNRFKKLEKLKTDFRDKAERIILVNEDANKYLQKFCKKKWQSHRAVLFLDPFGMQVTWDTLSAIANTKAIDLWILFPLGSGVSRLLRRNGKIPESLKNKMTSLFGEDKWFDAFYQEKRQFSLFEEDSSLEKVADFETISAYFVSRLKVIFPHVHPKPLPLYNSKNNPLFLLCFAASNEIGGKTAVKIASDILRR